MALTLSVGDARRLVSEWYHHRMAMTLRLSEEQDRALVTLAEALGVSKQEAAARAIVEAAERRGHEATVSELSASARHRYADLLDRLGR